MRNFLACRHCPNRMGCKRHGCFAWNQEARKKIEADERKLAEDYPENTALGRATGLR